VGKNEVSLLTGGGQANVARGDDLKVRPTECNGQMERMEAEQNMQKMHFLVPKPKRKWPKHLGLVRATPLADFTVIGVQLCSTLTAIFSRVALSYKN